LILHFKGKRISDILAVVPEHEVRFEEELTNYEFPEAQSLRLKKIMGYDRHRIAKPETTPSDFCVFGLNYLLANKKIRKDEIGAIVTVSVTPDYFMPHISNILHGKLGLSQDVLCLDLSQGCVGFLEGLMQAYLLLDYVNGKKVVLFNADVLSHKVSKKDRNSYPLIGDAATVTIIENSDITDKSLLNMKTDGTGRDNLIIPAGGSRCPNNEETSTLKKDDEGNYRSLDHLVMNGAEVFKFVQTEVPLLISETFAESDWEIEDIDWFFFHQPNKFMLQKLAERCGIPKEKMPMNIVEKFGNPSGASIPLTIASELGSKMMDNNYKCCLSAFGSGLAWGAAIFQIGKLNSCELIESNL
jgi:3-oxoacyl-[acyl-carrier-protein] synthase-3